VSLFLNWCLFTKRLGVRRSTEVAFRYL